MKQLITRIELLVVGLLATLASLAAVQIDGIYYSFYSSSETAKVTNSKDGSPKDYSGDVVIPKEVTYDGKTYPVTEIGEYAFDGCTGLTSVTFPESLTSIGVYAFRGCTGLTSVTFPESLTSIKIFAFYGCTGLVNLDFRCAAIFLSAGCFSECGSFDSVLFDCKEIRYDYFVSNPYEDPFGSYRGNVKIKTLTIGSGVLSISGPDSIWAYKTIWLGNTPPSGSNHVSSYISYVSNDAFGFKNQKIYPFLSSRFTVGGTVYVPVNPSERTCDVIDCSYDTDVKDIVIADKVTNRGIELTVGEINPYSFYRNDYITDVQLSNNGNIGECAYFSCNNLASLKVQNQGNVGESAFNGCSAITEANIKATNIGTNAFYQSATQEAAKFTIETGEIGESAFSGCSAITEANVKATNIGAKGFYQSATNEVAMFTIETGNIGAYAFSGCSAITVADIEATSIDSYGFSGCTNLASATLAEVLTGISNNAFAASGLESIVIPNSVTSLGEEVFYNCGKLASVSIGNSVSALAKYTFAKCSSLPEITIPANIGSVGDYVFSGCTSLAKVNIADRQTELTLGSNGSNPLFVDCPLDDVYIGGDISYPTASGKGYSPFYRNTSLRSVKITDKETEISPNEFYGCTNLQEVVIGDGVETIGNYAFSGCSALKSFAFGFKVKTIGEEAFSDCTAMTSLTSHNPVPPVCGTQALDDINKWDCTLYVPAASIDTYKAAPQWKEFFFYGEAPLGIGDVNGEQVAGFELEAVGGNALRIGGAEDRGVEVYGVDGRCEWRTASYDGTAVELAPGMHIVRVGGISVKVMLK